jgi:hypothetical protein
MVSNGIAIAMVNIVFDIAVKHPNIYNQKTYVNLLFGLVVTCGRYGLRSPIHGSISGILNLLIN